MILGVRQCGKTYIINEFCQNEYKNVVQINLLQRDDIVKLYETDLTSDEKFNRLKLILNSELEAEDIIFFIDEIQAYPHLLTLLKFLSQDEKFTFIASGSLLGVTLSQTTSIPMGSIRKVRMFPLDFEEFLYANGLNEFAISAIRKKFEREEPLDEATHNKIMDLFRKYLLVGGLPDAVNSYLNDHNIQLVREIQNEIHDYYAADASKYDEEKKLKIRRIYDLIPSNMEYKK